MKIKNLIIIFFIFTKLNFFRRMSLIIYLEIKLKNIIFRYYGSRDK